MDKERSVGGKRGLNAGQSGGGCGVEVLALDFGGGTFFGAIEVWAIFRFQENAGVKFLTGSYGT